MVLFRYIAQIQARSFTELKYSSDKSAGSLQISTLYISYGPSYVVVSIFTEGRKKCTHEKDLATRRARRSERKRTKEG